MKYLLLIIIPFIIVIGNQTQEFWSPYNQILEKVRKIDTSKYFITFEIKQDYTVKNNLCELLNSKRNLNIKDCLKNKMLNYSCKIDPHILKLIEDSKQNMSEKIEINYIFSSPYIISSDRIFILNSIHYKPAPNVTKGGMEQVLFYKKDGKKWKLQKRFVLNEI